MSLAGNIMSPTLCMQHALAIVVLERRVAAVAIRGYQLDVDPSIGPRIVQPALSKSTYLCVKVRPWATRKIT